MAKYNSRKRDDDDYVKRSGARFGTAKDTGKPFVSAWKKDSGGYHTLFAYPYKKSEKSISKSGKTWVSMFVTITNKRDMTQVRYSGMLDLNAKRLYIRDLNMIVTNTNGGYWGRQIFKEKKRR